MPPKNNTLVTVAGIAVPDALINLLPLSALFDHDLFSECLRHWKESRPENLTIGSLRQLGAKQMERLVIGTKVQPSDVWFLIHAMELMHLSVSSGVRQAAGRVTDPWRDHHATELNRRLAHIVAQIRLVPERTGMSEVNLPHDYWMQATVALLEGKKMPPLPSIQVQGGNASRSENGQGQKAKPAPTPATKLPPMPWPLPLPMISALWIGHVLSWPGMRAFVQALDSGCQRLQPARERFTLDLPFICDLKQLIHEVGLQSSDFSKLLRVIRALGHDLPNFRLVKDAWSPAHEDMLNARLDQLKTLATQAYQGSKGNTADWARYLVDELDQVPIAQSATIPGVIAGGAMNIKLIPVALIRPMRGQPRQEFNGLESLRESMEQGQLDLLKVRPLTDDDEVDPDYPNAEFELVDGERRLRAAHQGGILHLWVIVIEGLDRDAAFLLSARANQNRQGHTTAETIRIVKIMGAQGLSVPEICKTLGYAEATIARFERLGNLDDKLVEAIARKSLHAQAADYLARLKAPEQLLVFAQLQKKGASQVAEARGYVRALLHENRDAARSGKSALRTRPADEFAGVRNDVTTIHERAMRVLDDPTRIQLAVQYRDPSDALQLIASLREAKDGIDVMIQELEKVEYKPLPLPPPFKKREPKA